MKFIKMIFDLAVVVIGIIMVVSYAGAALAPLLSGIAFILIGVSHLMKK